MYSVAELSKIFNTSRKTMYIKLKEPEIREFVYQAEKGLRLKQEGFNVLQVLLSKSKLAANVTEEVNNDVTVEYNAGEKIELINILKEQVEELKKEKLEWKEEKAEIQKKYDEMIIRYDTLVGALLEQQKQQLLLENEKSRPFWKKIFRVN